MLRECKNFWTDPSYICSIQAPATGAASSSKRYPLWNGYCLLPMHHTHFYVSTTHSLSAGHQNKRSRMRHSDRVGWVPRRSLSAGVDVYVDVEAFRFSRPGSNSVTPHYMYHSSLFQ